MSVKFFNKWDSQGIVVKDVGLRPYINLTPVIAPRTGGRNIKISFHKNKTSIVERLINKLMIPGHKGKKHTLTSYKMTGKQAKNFNTVKHVLEIVEQKTKQNPIAVLVKAIENAAPREEITTIEYGGARYPQAVECSPQRRVDFALRLFVQGAYAKSFNKKKGIVQSLSEEIIKASNNDNTSLAISKKIEVEKQADSSR